jgi:hypothetical protein
MSQPFLFVSNVFAELFLFGSHSLSTELVNKSFEEVLDSPLGMRSDSKDSSPRDGPTSLLIGAALGFSGFRKEPA